MSRKRRSQSALSSIAIQSEMFPTHKAVEDQIQQVKKIRDAANRAFVRKRQGVWGNSKATQTALKKKSKEDNQRQGTDTDEDPFSSVYGQFNLVETGVSFSELQDIVEASDILQVCISLVVDAIDGNGHTFNFLGLDKVRSEADDKIRQNLADFFSNPNELGTFIRVRRALRWDLESTGNAAAEVVRDRAGKVDLLYHLPITYMRMTLPDAEATPYQAKVLRNGKLVEVTRYKRFRRYCRILPSGLYQWFKEFGDPRTVDRVTGEYDQNSQNPATECWWFKISFRNQEYGMPRWYSLTDVIKARILAHYVNYKVFTSQGIPPVLIAVEGGRLTDGSVTELENTIESWKDVDNWNSTVVVQAEPLDDFALSDKGISKPTIQIHKLRDARAEDAQFEKFLNYSAIMVCRCWRIPSLLLGGAENLNLASANASQLVAEQYFFIALRQEFDEVVNFRLIRGEFGIWDWEFRSLGVKTTGSEELAKVIRTVALSGGATMNNVVDLANDMLGTSWSKDDSPISNIPVVWALALARLGRIHIGPDKKLIILSPMEAQGSIPLPGQEVPQQQSLPLNGTNGTTNKAKFQALLGNIEDEALKRMMAQIEEEFEGWEPGEIQDSDFAMQV